MQVWLLNIVDSGYYSTVTQALNHTKPMLSQYSMGFSMIRRSYTLIQAWSMNIGTLTLLPENITKKS